MVISGDDKQVNCDKLSSNENRTEFERLEAALKSVQDQNELLVKQLAEERQLRKEAELRAKKNEKELGELKRINDIQENCIESAEAEIFRLNQCLMENEKLFQENIDTSQVRKFTMIVFFIEYLLTILYFQGLIDKFS